MSAVAPLAQHRRVYVPYAPRGVWRPFHTRTQRWAVSVAHRRSGKTTAGIADMLKRALEGLPDGRYAFIAPFYSQAKTIAWGILQALTREVADSVNQSELRVTLINGAQIRLFGADKPDSLRGQRLDGAQCDEYADFKPDVFPDVIRPALADRGGWCVFSGTPKGPGLFKDLYDYAREHTDQFFVAYLPNSETGILSADECADMRTMMSDEVYQQEVECSWTAPRSGSFYGKLLAAADAQGRIGHYPPDPNQPVQVAMDIGWRDATAAWFWQARPGGWDLVDWDEGSGYTVDDWHQRLSGRGFDIEKLWVPHDARAKSMQTGRSTIEQFLRLGYKCAIAPELSVQQGIDAARLILPQCRFHHATTHPGVRHLYGYKRKWMEQHQAFSNDPVHGPESHTADAFRYFAVVARDFVQPAAGPQTPVARPVDQSYTLNALFHDAEVGIDRKEQL